jgi:hypothetical protein
MIKLMMKKCSKDGLVEIKNNHQKVLEDKKVFMGKEIDEDIDTIAHQDLMVELKIRLLYTLFRG